jgi:hypothetical protein
VGVAGSRPPPQVPPSRPPGPPTDDPQTQLIPSSSSSTTAGSTFGSLLRSGEEAESVLRTVDESEVDRLHNENLANLNGNYDKSGSFREWHETLTVQSYGGDDLLILPYTVIDF